MKFSKSPQRGKSTASAAPNTDIGSLPQDKMNQLWQQINTEGFQKSNNGDGSSVDNSLEVRR